MLVVEGFLPGVMPCDDLVPLETIKDTHRSPIAPYPVWGTAEGVNMVMAADDEDDMIRRIEWRSSSSMSDIIDSSLSGKSSKSWPRELSSADRKSVV